MDLHDAVIYGFPYKLRPKPKIAAARIHAVNSGLSTSHTDRPDRNRKCVCYIKKTTSSEKCKAKIDTECVYICTAILDSDTICQHTSTQTVQVSSLSAIAPRI